MMKIHRKLFIRILASLGYTALALLILQVLALIIASFLQYSPYDQLLSNSSSNSSAIGVAMHDVGTMLPSRSPSVNQSGITMIVVTILLLATISLLVLYLTKIMAGITHSLLQFLGRPTLNKLPTVKIALAGVSFVIIATCAVVLPSVMPILPLDIGLVALCFVASLLEHALVTRAKLPITKAL